MAAVFSWRGDSIDARYAPGGKTGQKVGTSAASEITVTADAGVLGGWKIRFSGSTSKVLSWAGRLNTPNARLISVVHRIAPTYSGSPAGNRVLFPAIYVGPDRMGRIEMLHNSSGKCIVTAVNEAGTAVLNAVDLGSYSPTSGVANDLNYSYDMAGGANAFKLYNGTTLIGQATPSAAFYSSWNNKHFNCISLGNLSTSSLMVADSIEGAIYDTIIDPNNMALVSGNGALGDSRSSLLNIAALDGLEWTSLAANQILLGNTQTQAGVPVPGTAVAAVKANVKIGADGYDGPGEYDGSDRHTHPLENQVLEDVEWKDNSLTNNKIGSAIFNLKEDVKHGVPASDGLGEYRADDLWELVEAENLRLGEERLQNGSLITGTMEPKDIPDTAREVCDVVLKFIGADTLTDDEWDTIDHLTMDSTPQELYDALFSVMESREAVSSMIDRLKAYFAAKGVDVEEPAPSESTESQIFIGGGIDDPIDTVVEGKSNVLIGGEL